MQRYERSGIVGPQSLLPLGSKPRTEHRPVILRIVDVAIGRPIVNELESEPADETLRGSDHGSRNERGEHIC